MIFFGLQLLIHTAPVLVFKTMTPRIKSERGERSAAYIVRMSASMLGIFVMNVSLQEEKDSE